MVAAYYVTSGFLINPYFNRAQGFEFIAHISAIEYENHLCLEMVLVRYHSGLSTVY